MRKSDTFLMIVSVLSMIAGVTCSVVIANGMATDVDRPTQSMSA